MDDFLKSPITALVAGFLFSAIGLIALNGRYMVFGYILLAVAWLLIIFSLRSQPILFWIGFSLVAAAFLSFAGYYLKPPDAPSNAGTLRPQVLLSPDGIRPRIEIGETGTSISETDPFGTLILPFLKKEQFKIEIIDRAAKFSTKITDENNHLVAEIVHNEWLVSPPPESWDRNYNDDTLEVKDASGDIVLQVRAFADHIQFQGVWWVERFVNLGKTRIEIWENKSARPWSAEIYIIPTNGSPKPIDPVFNYPSAQHLGELR